MKARDGHVGTTTPASGPSFSFDYSVNCTAVGPSASNPDALSPLVPQVPGEYGWFTDWEGYYIQLVTVLLPLGTSTVTCSATDAEGNVGTESFNVTVVGAASGDTTPIVATGNTIVTDDWTVEVSSGSGVYPDDTISPPVLFPIEQNCIQDTQPWIDGAYTPGYLGGQYCSGMAYDFWDAMVYVKFSGAYDNLKLRVTNLPSGLEITGAESNTGWSWISWSEFFFYESQTPEIQLDYSTTGFRFQTTADAALGPYTSVIEIKDGDVTHQIPFTGEILASTQTSDPTQSTLAASAYTNSTSPTGRTLSLSGANLGDFEGYVRFNFWIVKDNVSIFPDYTSYFSFYPVAENSQHQYTIPADWVAGAYDIVWSLDWSSSPDNTNPYTTGVTSVTIPALPSTGDTTPPTVTLKMCDPNCDSGIYYDYGQPLYGSQVFSEFADMPSTVINSTAVTVQPHYLPNSPGGILKFYVQASDNHSGSTTPVGNFDTPPYRHDYNITCTGGSSQVTPSDPSYTWNAAVDTTREYSEGSGSERTWNEYHARFFSLGTTTVTCSATDAEGNVGTNSFTVTMSSPDAETIPPVIEFETWINDGHLSTDELVPLSATKYLSTTNSTGEMLTVGVRVTDDTTVTDYYSGSPHGWNWNQYYCNGGYDPDLDCYYVVDGVTIPASDFHRHTTPGWLADGHGVMVPTCSAPGPDRYNQNTGILTGHVLFPVGTTTVTCSATDEAGNTGTASFTVIVTLEGAADTTPPTVTLKMCDLASCQNFGNIQGATIQDLDDMPSTFTNSSGDSTGGVVNFYVQVSDDHPGSTTPCMTMEIPQRITITL